MCADCCFFGFCCDDCSTFLTFRLFAFCCTFRLFAAFRLFAFCCTFRGFSTFRFSRKILIVATFRLFAFRLFALSLAFSTYPCPQPFANTARDLTRLNLAMMRMVTVTVKMMVMMAWRLIILMPRQRMTKRDVAYADIMGMTMEMMEMMVSVTTGILLFWWCREQAV